MTRTTLRPFATGTLVGCLFFGCAGQDLDAGTTFVAEVAERPLSARATAPALIDAITMDATHLYFTCEDGWVYRLAKQGTEPPQKVVSFPGTYAVGIAVDDSSVYFTAFVNGEGAGVVRRAPKEGGASTTLAEGQSRPWGIAVDDARVYWVEQGAAPPDANDDTGGATSLGAIFALPKSGGEPKALAGQANSGDVIALDDDNVYWHELEAIRRVSKEGGSASTLASSALHTASSNLVVAGGRLYWAQEAGTWSVSSVATTGGPSVTLAANVDQPSSVGLFGGALYWSDAQGSTVGAIRSVPTGGGNQTVISPPNASGNVDEHVVSFVLVDEKAFYIVQYWGQPSLHVVIDELPR